jgi:hypothetical protein
LHLFGALKRIRTLLGIPCSSCPFQESKFCNFDYLPALA